VWRSGKDLHLGTFPTAEEAALAAAGRGKGGSGGESGHAPCFAVRRHGSLKEEAAVPPMPHGTFVKEESVVPPMPPDACVKAEVVVKEEEGCDSRPKRQRTV